MFEEERDNDEQSSPEEPTSGDKPDQPVEEIDKAPGRPRDAAAEVEPVLEETQPEPTTPPETLQPEAGLPGEEPREELAEELAEAEEAPEPEDIEEVSPAEQDDWVTAPSAGAKVYETPEPPTEVIDTEPKTEPQPIPVQEQWAVPSEMAEPVEDYPTPTDVQRPPTPEGNAFGFIGDLLANLGIRDRQAQQWVAIGAAVVLFMCCSCACVIPLLSAFAQ